MLRVPTYDNRQVMTAALPGVQQGVPRGVDAGAMLGRAWQGMGEAVGHLGAALEKGQARAQAETDESAVKEAAARAEDAMRELMLNPQSGYLARQGRAAVESLGGVKESVEALQKEIFGSLSESQQRIFSPVFSQMRSQALDGAYRHAAQQREVRLVDASNARLGSVERTVGTVGGSALPQALGTLSAEMKDQAETLNLPPEVAHRRLQEEGTRLTGMAVAKALDAGQTDQAVALIEQNSHWLSEEQATRWLETVAARRDYGAAQDYAAALSMDEAAPAPDGLSDQAQAMAQDIARTMRHERQQEHERKARANRDEAWNGFDSGATYGTLPFHIQQNLSDTERADMEIMNERRLGLRPDETDPFTYMMLASKNPEEWKKTDLNTYRTKLSSEDFARLRTRAADPATAQYSRSWRAVKEMMGWGNANVALGQGFSSEKLEAFSRTFDDRLDQALEGGRPLSNEDVQKIAIRLLTA